MTGTPERGSDVHGPAGYLSTSCLHGIHEHCRSRVAIDGWPKRPGQCKHCEALCRCPVCHRAAEPVQQ